MAITFANAKIAVARTDGGQNDADQLSAAGDALLNAIQKWNLRKNWRFLLIDNSGDPIDIVEGTDTYALPFPFKRPYTARLLSRNRTLKWTEQRHVDRSIRDQTANGLVSHYTLFNGATDFDSSTSSGQVGSIKLIKSPSYTLADDLVVRYYRPIAEPAGDATTMDVPDRYVFALITLGKYFYLVDKDTENARLQAHMQDAEVQFRQCVSEDQGVMEDDEARLIPQTEYGAAFGATDLPPDPWSI